MNALNQRSSTGGPRNFDGLMTIFFFFFFSTNFFPRNFMSSEPELYLLTLNTSARKSIKKIDQVNHVNRL